MRGGDAVFIGKFHNLDECMHATSMRKEIFVLDVIALCKDG